MVYDIFLKYSVCIVITFVVVIVSPFNVFTSNNQNVSAISLHINNSYDRLVVQMENYDSYSSYIHYIDIFSDLSRNMTTSSSSDLSEEDNTIPTEEIGQDNINAEDDLRDEATVDTSQSSSSP